MNRFFSGRSLSPIRQAEAYWTALLDGNGIPNRSDIDPRGLGNILQFTFVLERVAPSVARFRLAGSHMTELAGMEVRGMPLSAFFTPPARDEISGALKHVFGSPAVAELELATEPRLRAPKLEARMILLPLKSDLGDVSRALGVLVADEVKGKTPTRFDIETCRIKPVSNITKTQDHYREPALGFAESQSPFVSPAPHLRLVSSKEE